MKRAAALVLALVVLAGCGLGRSEAAAYLDERYTPIANNRWRASAPPGTVADDIAGRFRPDDRVSDPGGEFLRYDDALVAVLPEGDGSLVELDGYERGYNRYGGFFIGVFPLPSRVRGRGAGPFGGAGGAGGGGFRGGGPGFGK